MIFSFLEKHNDFHFQKWLLEKLIEWLNIPDEEKKLFHEALWIADESRIQKLYDDILQFVHHSELKNISQIETVNFSSIDWMTFEQAEAKKQDINSFHLLLSQV